VQRSRLELPVFDERISWKNDQRYFENFCSILGRTYLGKVTKAFCTIPSSFRSSR